MKRLVMLVAVGVALAGCGEPSPEQLAEKAAEEARMADEVRKYDAEDSVRAVLTDPESARFSRLFVSRQSGLPVVCGMVNAKNRFGGYVGDRPFYSVGRVAEIGTPENYDQFQKAWSELCKAS